MLIILTTVPNEGMGRELARGLLESKLAGCIQILPPMSSIYVWDGSLTSEAEHLVLIKTTDENWEPVRDFITTNHPYDVPEIVAVDVDKVSAPYADWLRAVTDPGSDG